MSEWVLLAYRLPREPSTPRIALWRQLRRLGAVQLVDGLVGLPADPRTIEAFEWLADEVAEAGGEAWTWQARPGSKDQERLLRERVTDAAVKEYQALLVDVEESAAEPTRRAVARLRRTFRKIEARDPFAPPERDVARRAIDELAATIAAAELQRSAR